MWSTWSMRSLNFLSTKRLCWCLLFTHRTAIPLVRLCVLSRIFSPYSIMSTIILPAILRCVASIALSVPPSFCPQSFCPLLCVVSRLSHYLSRHHSAPNHSALFFALRRVYRSIRPAIKIPLIPFFPSLRSFAFIALSFPPLIFFFKFLNFIHLPFYCLPSSAS